MQKLLLRSKRTGMFQHITRDQWDNMPRSDRDKYTIEKDSPMVDVEVKEIMTTAKPQGVLTGLNVKESIAKINLLLSTGDREAIRQIRDTDKRITIQNYINERI